MRLRRALSSQPAPAGQALPTGSEPQKVAAGGGLLWAPVGIWNPCGRRLPAWLSRPHAQHITGCVQRPGSGTWEMFNFEKWTFTAH